MSHEIEAARIAAQATIEAAWIQGGLTVFAGVLAVLGGSFAYFGAVRQVRLDEKRYKVRVTAYRFRIGALADELDGLARVCWGEALIALRRFREADSSYSIPIYALPLFPEFSDEHWEDHALLGQEAVRAIHNVRSNLREYMLFRKEVLRKSLKCDDFPEHNSTIGNPIENDDGSISFRTTTVVEQNEIFSRNIVKYIKCLKAAIK